MPIDTATVPPSLGTTIWTSLIGPAVVAAGMSALVSWWTNARRFAVDRELAERRAAADIALAERRVSLDFEFDVRKRRALFAEEVLADVYQAREIIEAARSPMGVEGDGSTRQRFEWETEDDARQLDGIYTTAERLQKNEHLFAQLFARRYRFVATFGEDSKEAYDQIFRIQREILLAVRHLMMGQRQRRQETVRQQIWAHWETVIWDHGEDDPISPRLSAAVQAVERICRAAILEPPSL